MFTVYISNEFSQAIINIIMLAINRAIVAVFAAACYSKNGSKTAKT